MKIIGIAGTNGSGKDTVGRLLAQQYGYLFVSVTDILREEIKKRGLPSARENMRTLSAEWRREFGLGVLVDKALEIYKSSAVKYNGLAIASLRNSGEVDRVHELRGTVVWVDAAPQVRYKRIQTGDRGRLDDDKTYKQFLAEEQDEMNHSGDDATLNMAAVKIKADIFLQNDLSDLAQLGKKLAKSLRYLTK